MAATTRWGTGMNVPAVLGQLRASPLGQFGQKFMDDRALTLASLVAWGMLNTFLPLLLGVLALLGLLLGDSPAAATAEAMLLAALPAGASRLVSESFAAIQQTAGVAGLVSLGLLLFNGSNFFVTLGSVFDLAYHVPERHPLTQRLVSVVALIVLTGLVLLATGAAAVGGVFGQALSTAIPWLGAADRCRPGGHRLGGGLGGVVRLAVLGAAQRAGQSAPGPARGARFVCPLPGRAARLPHLRGALRAGLQRLRGVRVACCCSCSGCTSSGLCWSAGRSSTPSCVIPRGRSPFPHSLRAPSPDGWKYHPRTLRRR